MMQQGTVLPANPQTIPRMSFAGHEPEIVALIPALRAFARSFHRNAFDVDDLVQETLVRGIANIHQFRPGTNLKSWLFTIMRNTFYTKVKVYTREAPGSADCASQEPVIQPGQEWRVRRNDVCRLIQELPQEQREVLILISMIGVSYLDAAEICECAMGTVKSRLNRARQTLAEMAGGDAPAEMIMAN